MKHSQITIKEMLLQELQTSNHPIDMELVETIAKEFYLLASNWHDESFELRDKQLLFSYLAAYEALEEKNTTKPLALSLGCGEGKQEGFAIAMKSALELLYSQQNHAKVLFLTATPDLVSQMKDSLPLQDTHNIYLVDENFKAQDGKKDGIYSRLRT